MNPRANISALMVHAVEEAQILVYDVSGSGGNSA
jgi:hypothetical protein